MTTSSILMSGGNGTTTEAAAASNNGQQQVQHHVRWRVKKDKGARGGQDRGSRRGMVIGEEEKKKKPVATVAKIRGEECFCKELRSLNQGNGRERCCFASLIR